MIGKPPFRFVPTETKYDNPEKTNLFSINLNLDYSTTAQKEKSGIVEEGESKKKGKDSQLQLKVVQLCSGDVEVYIKCSKQLRQVWSQKPCETPKANTEMISHMLHGDLKDTWDMLLIEASMELNKWN